MSTQHFLKNKINRLTWLPYINLLNLSQFTFLLPLADKTGSPKPLLPQLPSSPS